MKPVRALVLILAALSVARLLGLALWQWQRMTQDLEEMGRQLQQAAAAQQLLQRRLQETRRLLEREKARLRQLEARQREISEQPTTGEAGP